VNLSTFGAGLGDVEGHRNESLQPVALPASACPFDQDCEFCNAF
jgi:hypothetical protein